MNQKVKKYIITLLIFIAIIVITTAVQRMKSKVQKSSPKAAIFSNYTVTYNEEFSHFPIIAEATETRRYSEDDEGTLAMGGDWEVAGTVPEVAAWYIRELQAAGWQLTSTPTNPQDPENQAIEGRKGNRTFGIAFFPKAEDKVKIMANFPHVKAKATEGVTNESN